MIPALKPTKGSIIKRLPFHSLLYSAPYLAAAAVGLVLVNNHHNIFYHHQTFQKQFGKIFHTYDKHNFLTALYVVSSCICSDNNKVNNSGDSASADPKTVRH